MCKSLTPVKIARPSVRVTDQRRLRSVRGKTLQEDVLPDFGLGVKDKRVSKKCKWKHPLCSVFPVYRPRRRVHRPIISAIDDSAVQHLIVHARHFRTRAGEVPSPALAVPLLGDAVERPEVCVRVVARISTVHVLLICGRSICISTEKI